MIGWLLFWLFVDFVLILVVLCNLIGNVVKYSCICVVVCISIELVEDVCGVGFVISDNGVGF